MRNYTHMPRTSFLLVAGLLLTLPLAVSAEDLVFTPLTSIPGIESIASTDSLTVFLNALYRICVGAAAVLAVIQITRAGAMYMLPDSFTEKKEARHLISVSIFGLILVLAPTIVFSIIDPRILSLRIGVEGLGFEEAGEFNFTSCEEGDSCDVSDDPDAAENCTDRGGTPVTLVNGSIQCNLPSEGQDSLFPLGSTQISQSQIQACETQSGCEARTANQNQYTCACSGAPSLTGGQFFTIVMTRNHPQHTSCEYVQIARYPDEPTCRAAVPQIRAALEARTISDIFYECTAPSTSVRLGRDTCSDVGTYGG